MVRPCLGAAEGVSKGIQSVYTALNQILVVPGQGLGNVVDAAHGGDYPNFVSDTGPAVGAEISHKAAGFCRFRDWIILGS